MSDESSEFVNDVEIFSTDDKKLKMLAEVISNESSRNILSLLFKEEITANEISKRTEISLPLIRYHLEKMQRINLVVVSRVEKNSKSHDMNYYKAARLGIVITHSDVTEKAKSSKLLKKSFRSIYRFFGLGIASAAAAFSIMLTASYSSFLDHLKSWYSSFTIPVDTKGTGLPYSVDESFYLAKTKVDSVVSNPGAGPGTPVFDPYPAVLGFTTTEFILTLAVLAGMGAALSLPLFIKAYRYSKWFPNAHSKPTGSKN